MDGETINTLLMAAIALGVAMIVMAMLINVFTGLRNRDWEKALFSNNGVAGLVFYGAVLAGMVSMLTGGPNLFIPALYPGPAGTADPGDLPQGTPGPACQGRTF